MIDEKRKMFWYNYKTGQYEERGKPEDFTDYIPQDPVVLALYGLYLEMGKSPTQAAELVLLAVVGETKDEPAQ